MKKAKLTATKLTATKVTATKVTASRRVTPETLAGLGAERLGEILAGVAETRPDLKRRLRMEIAAQQGPGALAPEIDKRLAAFETSRGKVTWRQAPAFLRDVDALRELIAGRLAEHDAGAAVERLWRFMATARQLDARYGERGSELDRIFAKAAADLGRLLAHRDVYTAAFQLAEALSAHPSGWQQWLPGLLAEASAALAQRTLLEMAERPGGAPGGMTLVRQLADAAGDVDAYRATWTEAALRTPSVAAEAARRYLAAGRTEDAGDVLRGAAPKSTRAGATPPDFDWESAWLDYLDQAGRAEAAQAARWASFERTLAVDRARAFIGRLADFDDVAAETRAFAVAAAFDDAEAGLRFLMGWPALAEAAQMIEARGEEISLAPDVAELWAARLRRRFPKAAHRLLCRAAAAALRRRDFKSSDRLTSEAETIQA